MFTNATAPDLGAGPYGVEHDADDSFYYLTLDGTRTGKSYPLGKTAYRTARKLNDEHTGEAGGFLEDAPLKVTPSPTPGGDAGAGDAPARPKAKASRKARPDARVKAKAAKPAPKPTPAPKVATPKAKAGRSTHSTVVFQGTREEWLNAFVAAARPIFADLELKLPEKIRVSVGFPHRGRKNTIGQCWHESASADGTREIFVIPTLDDSERIADVLTHELAHTLFGPDEKHGKNFKAAVTKLGLEGKATATIAGPGWQAWALPILEKLGPIPHAAIDTTGDTRTKQKTYLVKGECEDCGFVVRLTAKWVNAAKGTLQCPDSDCSGFLCVGDGEGEEGGE